MEDEKKKPCNHPHSLVFFSLGGGAGGGRGEEEGRRVSVLLLDGKKDAFPAISHRNRRKFAHSPTSIPARSLCINLLIRMGRFFLRTIVYPLFLFICFRFSLSPPPSSDKLLSLPQASRLLFANHAPWSPAGAQVVGRAAVIHRGG